VADGFLGRWSQRKQALRDGKPIDEPPQTWAIEAIPAVEPQGVQAPAVQESPPLSLEDAQALSADSDFKPFVAPEVAPEVRNAAMKKLFADPHYNVMDGMDTYIDDYSKADPLPESLLRQMASASFLKLFEDSPESATPESTADSKVLEADTHHDHTDLRLQPNNAAGSQGPGRGTQ